MSSVDMRFKLQLRGWAYSRSSMYIILSDCKHATALWRRSYKREIYETRFHPGSAPKPKFPIVAISRLHSGVLITDLMHSKVLQQYL